ncbi:MAG: fibronectin type III domain-containing protein [Syntrophobacteraceae bacterium]
MRRENVSKHLYGLFIFICVMCLFPVFPRAANAIGTGPASSTSDSVTPADSGTAPGAPTGVSATAGNAQATVSFTAPASNGGSAITGYSVTSKPAGGVDLDAGTTSAAHTVDGLTNGKAYTFTVTAGNAIGTGPASSPSNKVTPAAKNAKKPTVTVLEPKQNASVPGDSVVVQGTASDKSGVASVWWCVNGCPWQQASGTAKWTANVPLVPGVNSVEVYSQDPVGNVSAIASLSLVSLENLVDSYWPMNDGDEKNYTGVVGTMTMSFAATGSQSFDLTINPADSSGDSGDIFYELDASDDLLLTSEDYLQYTLDFEPPLLELDAALLAKGGSKTSSSTGTIEDINVRMTQTVSVKNAGTVTVPAGTYQNCMLASQAITASVPGHAAVSASSQDYVLARGVGVIKAAVIELSANGSTKLIGWEDLVSGTVAGVPVGNLASVAADKSGPVIGASLDDLIKTNEQAMPKLQIETPLAVLEFTRYDDGESKLVLRGRSGYGYVLEAGAPDESGDLVWTPLWAGVLTEGPLSLSVPGSGAGTVYRVR